MAASIFFRFLPFYFLLNFVEFRVSCTAVENKMYIPLTDTTNMCIRQLNGTHQFGCSSGYRSQVGVVHLVNSTDDMTWLLEKGPHNPYIVILEPDMFTRSVIMRLVKSEKVNGILLVRTNDTYPSNGYSSDKKCPNRHSGMYSGDKSYCTEGDEWNPTGSGLFQEDLDIPMFVVKTHKEKDDLYDKCWSRNKPVNGVPKDYPLCGAELKASMHGAKNSESCYRRTVTLQSLSPSHYCDPMGDQNVHTTFKAVLPDEKLENKSIIMAVAKMDALSLFYRDIPGANSPITGVVTLLAASEALGVQSVKDDILKSKNDIMFTFLHGESYDYIGSSRMVYDMVNGWFRQNMTHKDKGLHKIELGHLKGIVEVSQVGQGVNTEKLYLHTDAENKKHKEVTDMLTTLKKYAPDNLTVSESSSKSLPPASLQTFLKAKPDIPGVVIADHDDAFTNKFFHSIYDEPAQIQADYPEEMLENQTETTAQALHLQKVATLVARLLFTMATGEDDATHVEANITSINQMLYCFIANRKCDFLKSLLTEKMAKTLDKTWFDFYVSVDSQQSAMASVTRQMLAYFTGERNLTSSVDDCKERNKLSKRGGGPWRYLGMQGQLIDGKREALCVKTLANYSDAISPAFSIKDYDFKSGVYPTWTESQWAGASFVRIFMIPSQKIQTTTLSVGVIIFLVSGLITFFVSRRARILFPGHTSHETL